MTASGLEQSSEDLLVAVADLVGRTGAETFSFRLSDTEQPVVWIAIASYDNPKGNQGRGTRTIWVTAAALTPIQAAVRLAEQVVDGGNCVHCKRPTGVSTDWAGEQPLDELLCWYVYDPELKRFRRGCEGRP